MVERREDFWGKINDYWFGLGIPMCFGLGASLISLLILISMAETLDISVVLFLATLLHVGHAIVWPALASFFLFRGKKSENLSLVNGTKLSLKLYAVWLVFIIAPFIWFASTFNGIV